MINTGDIEAGHNLSTEEYEKLQYDKVLYKKSLTSDTCLFNVSEFLNIYSKLQIGEGQSFGRQLYIEHCRDFRRDREFVNHQKLKSQKPEEELFFFEVDGMDQS